MFSALLSRLLKTIFLLLAVVALNFILIRLAPGDPASVMAGESGAADPAYVAQLRQQFKLDQPLWQQMGEYLHHIAMLDLGQSYRQNRPVLDLICERLPATILLTGTAFILALVLGVLIGLLAGLKRGTWLDSTLMIGALALYAMPLFWTGLVLSLIFSGWLGWLPASGMMQPGRNEGLWAQSLDIGRHLILPAVTLASFYVGLYARMMRGALVDIAQSDFVKAAKAKGVGAKRLVFKHMLRNACLPVVSLAGVQAGQLVGGAVLVETVFAWPGIGRLAFDSLMQRDFMTLLGVFVVTALLVSVFNALFDILQALIDPRIRA